MIASNIHIDYLDQHMSPVDYHIILKYQIIIFLFSIDEICFICHNACLNTFEEHVIHCKELLGVKY